MGNRKSPNAGNARFIELGSPGAPFRSLINVDHISNIRFEQKIEQMPATPDEDETRMEHVLTGWNIIIQLGETGQTIFFPEERQAVDCYNTILDMIGGTGNPLARMPKLRPMPASPQASAIVDANGAPIADDVPPLTEEELDALEHPEIDVDAIAEAVEDGLGTDDDDRG